MRHPRSKWPDVPRIVYGPGRDPRLDAKPVRFVGRDDALSVYAMGYQQAAQALFSKAKRRGPGYLVFPLAFLWRHHFELSLKRIIALGREGDGKMWGFPANEHRLLTLWGVARPYVRKTAPTPGKDPDAKNVERNLREIEVMDEKSMTFRYSETRTGALSVPKPPRINLQTLNDGSEAAANFLSGVAELLWNDVNGE